MYEYVPECTADFRQGLVMTEIDGRIAQANGRLKAGRVGVAIERVHNRLYLRATLPPRPGANRKAVHQQRMALGIHANPAGVGLAEKEARKVGALLDCGEFDWTPYQRPGAGLHQAGSVGDWVTRFEAAYRPTVSGVTWKTDYERVFAQLDASAMLTPELLETAVLRFPVESRQRRRFLTTLGKLSEFSGGERHFSRAGSRYSPEKLEPRNLPPEAEILKAFESIKNPAWRWVFGAIAAFGLRNHEAFFLDTSSLEDGGHFVRVIEGKTGARNVWAFHQDWIDRFELRTVVLPQVSGSDHSAYGAKVTRYFSRELELPFTAYDLRHCWAIRTLELGLDISLAAQQMGHSLDVHSRIYHRWISDSVHENAYRKLIEQQPKIH